MADGDRRFLDISGIGIDRHDVVAVSLAPAVTGEKEPEIIARFEEFLFEPDAEEAAQGAAARHRAHRFAEIGGDRGRVLSKEIHPVETGFFFEKVAQRFGVAFCILQRLQIVVAVDADADRLVLAHLWSAETVLGRKARFLMAQIAVRLYLRSY